VALFFILIRQREGLTIVLPRSDQGI